MHFANAMSNRWSGRSGFQWPMFVVTLLQMMLIPIRVLLACPATLSNLQRNSSLDPPAEQSSYFA